MAAATCPLFERIETLFRQTFGEPSFPNSGKRMRQWSLPPLASLAPAAAGLPIAPINVLVQDGNGGWPPTVAVWIFDPHDEHDGASHRPIAREDQIDAVLQEIRQRVTAARSIHHRPASAKPPTPSSQPAC